MKKTIRFVAFTTQFYFSVPETIRLNSTYYFIMNIPNRQELQQITFNHSSDSDFNEPLQKMYYKTILSFSY